MTPEHIRLHPGLPPCWEDEDTLRIGFEHARVRLPHPTAPAQRFLSALRRGIRTEDLTSVAARSGLDETDVSELLGTLGPAVLGMPGSATGEPCVNSVTETRGGEHRHGLRTRIIDGDRPVHGMQAALEATALCAFTHTASVSSDAIDLVIVVDRFLERLERAHVWLAAGVPQLLLRFSDDRIVVGPLVSPTGAPCHTCAALELITEDPARPLLAAQLSTVTPLSESPISNHLAAAFAATLIAQWLAGDPLVHSRVWTLPITDGGAPGQPREHRLAPHPECACGVSEGSRREPHNEVC